MNLWQDVTLADVRLEAPSLPLPISLPRADLPLPPTPDEQESMKKRPLPPEPHPPPVKQQMSLTMVPPRTVPPRTFAGQQRVHFIRVHHPLCGTVQGALANRS